MNARPFQCFLEVIVLLAILAGCGRQDRVATSASHSADVPVTQTDSEFPSIAGLPPNQPNETGLPPEEINHIADKIQAANGVLTRDNKGRITAVDVARDRTPVDNVTARQILRLPRLEVLRLAVNTISPELLTKLTSQTQLTELLLRDAPMTDEQLAQLTDSLPGLTRLTLRRVIGVADSGIEAVVSLPNLEVLALIEMQLSGNQIASLKKIKRLRSLDLRLSEGLTADDYRPLTEMQHLKDVKLGGMAVDDAIVDVLRGLPSLNSLTIEDSPVTAHALIRLVQHPDLANRIRSVAFTRCYGLTDDVLSRIVILPNLETLSIRECPISGMFLVDLTKSSANKLPDLRTLVITRAFLPDQAIAVLPRFAGSLTRLDLSDVMLSPTAMQSVGKMHELRSLSLAGCALTNESLEFIADLKKLKTLNLSGNFGLTDEVAAMLDTLPELEDINTHDTSITSSRQKRRRKDADKY